jgi:hypothetical protein
MTARIRGAALLKVAPGKNVSMPFRLLVSERFQGIDSRGASRRQITRKQSHSYE